MRQQLEAQGIELPSSRNKYGNVPTEVDGHRCASKLEGRLYHDLNVMAAEKLILGHLSQVTVRLPSTNRMDLDELINRLQTYRCSKHPVPYMCPICSEINSIPTLVFADAKGFMTDAWRVKCKELEHVLGVKVQLIRR